MELSDKDLEKIREVARTVEYGKVVINISASSNHLDLDVHTRIRQDREPAKEKPKTNPQIKT